MSLVESVLFTDPQTKPGQFCIYCLRECYSEICPKCEDRLTEDEIEWEE